jgi:RNA polymerase sigma factor (sigma-70 family)
MSGMRNPGENMDRSPETLAPADVSWIREALGRFESRLVRYAARITRDVERARDVVQEVFLRLLREERERVEPRLCEWLFTVCRNLALDVRGKETKMKFLAEESVPPDASPAPIPPVAAEQAETRGTLLALVDTLPEPQQEVVRLKFQEGLSYKEISRVTHHSVSYVGVLLHQALKTIRQRIPSGSDLAPHA